MYSKFVDSNLKAHPSQKLKAATERAKSLWNSLKEKKRENKEKAEALIAQWNAQAASLNAKTWKSKLAKF